MGCSERQALAKAVVDALEQMRVSTEQLITAVKGTNSHFVQELYSQLTKAEREHERRMRALREHEHEHGCVSGSVMQPTDA